VHDETGREESIFLIAHDFEHLYWWQASSELPTMQFQFPKNIDDANFLSSESGSPAAIVDSSGSVEMITVAGTRTTLYGDGIDDLENARIWTDTLDCDSWYVAWLLKDGSIRSGLRGIPSVTRAADDLWNDPTFAAEFGTLTPFWYGRQEMHVATLNGLPCLIIVRFADDGAGVCFLDPKTLVSVRSPLVIREFVSELALASGRWLVAALLKKGNELRNRLLVWDLNSGAHLPVGGWLEKIGDVYHVIAANDAADSFQTFQVFRTLEQYPQENYSELVRFDWPSGQITQLERFRNLRIWPVKYDPSEE
jgi:hypothetical protein